MLELKHIRKSFDGVPVLKDITLQVADGEIVSILSPSGCGKTTLLNLILGIADADGGHIRYDGQDLTSTPMEKRGFNIVFQDYALFPNLNVYQNITYGLRNKPGISTEKEVNKLIELLGLREHLSKRIDQLSGNQKQRVALARTLVWKGMEKDGKWRFTSPTHVVLAFSKALDELEEEGGIPARKRRYTENNRLLIQKMRKMGFATYIDGRYQGPIITTFLYPAGVAFQFASFYDYIKERGYVIYPGKLTEMDTFRIGNIGEIYPEDIDKLTSIIAAFLEERKEQIA